MEFEHKEIAPSVEDDFNSKYIASPAPELIDKPSAYQTELKTDFTTLSKDDALGKNPILNDVYRVKELAENQVDKMLLNDGAKTNFVERVVDNSIVLLSEGKELNISINEKLQIAHTLNEAGIKENDLMLNTLHSNQDSNRYIVDSENSNVLSVGVSQDKAIEIYSNLKDQSDATIGLKDNNENIGYLVTSRDNHIEINEQKIENENNIGYENDIGQSGHTIEEEQYYEAFKDQDIAEEKASLKREEILENNKTDASISIKGNNEQTINYDVDAKQVEAIFESDVWRDLKGTHITAVDKPTLTVLGGQPGAGKSRLGYIVSETKGNNYINVNGDDFREYHPNFNEINEKHGTESALHTASFSAKMTALALDKSLDEKLNVVIEGTFRVAETPIKTLEVFKDNGYETNVMIATAPRDVSWTSTLERYAKMSENGATPRFTPKESHDVVVNTLAVNADKVLDSGYVDNMQVHSRDEKLYDSNENINKPSEVINNELHRDLTAKEFNQVMNNYESVQNMDVGRDVSAVDADKIHSDKMEFLERTVLDNTKELDKDKVIDKVEELLVTAGVAGEELKDKLEKVQNTLYKDEISQQKQLEQTIKPMELDTGLEK